MTDLPVMVVTGSRKGIGRHLEEHEVVVVGLHKGPGVVRVGDDGESAIRVVRARLLAVHVVRLLGTQS